MYEKFLILGHKGFLGQNIYNSLIEIGHAVTTIPSRIYLKNLEDIASKYFTNNTVVINCIASGVTPYSSNEKKDNLTNVELLEGLLKFFVESRSSRFIQFGTIYEVDEDVKSVTDRLAYVNSKVFGSKLTKNYGEKDTRIKLLYLPTILGHNQPDGRFFIDFIKSANKNLPFIIHNPNATIKVALYDSLFRHLCKVINSVDESVFHLPADATMRVVQFSTLLNSLLVKNSFSSVNVVTYEPLLIEQDELEFDDDFVKNIEQLIISIAEKCK